MAFPFSSISLMQLNHGFDFVALTVVIILAAIGYNRGFLEELSRLIGLAIATFTAIKFYTPLSLWLQLRISIDEQLLSFASFLFLFFTFLFCTRLLTRLIQMFMLSKGISLANKSLGLIFGMVKGTIVIMVILWVVDIAPNPEYFDDFRTRSYIYRSFYSYRQQTITSFGLEETVTKGEAWVKDKVSPDS